MKAEGFNGVKKRALKGKKTLKTRPRKEREAKLRKKSRGKPGLNPTHARQKFDTSSTRGPTRGSTKGSTRGSSLTPTKRPSSRWTRCSGSRGLTRSGGAQGKTYVAVSCERPPKAVNVSHL